MIRRKLVNYVIEFDLILAASVFAVAAVVNGWHAGLDTFAVVFSWMGATVFYIVWRELPWVKREQASGD